ncbi:MAG TPA: hypothetical protein VI076_02270 [Actinopolymorphaceae bacterium]
MPCRAFQIFAKGGRWGSLLFSYIRTDFFEGEKMYGLERSTGSSS